LQSLNFPRVTPGAFDGAALAAGLGDGKPKRPKWRPSVQINFSRHRHDRWKHFIDLAYWNVAPGEDVE